MSDEKAKGMFPGWVNRNNLGLILLTLVVIASLIQVARTQEGMDPKGKVTIRICFWQLEGGYREGMAAEIKKYEALHPDRHIVMMPVTEKLYPQWLNSLLVNDMAPDLCEMGNGQAGSQLTNNDTYKGKYFLGLSDVLTKPNPYNKGTALENVPWRETFIDGMKGQFTEKLQEYYAVPMSFFGIGFFYNGEIMEGAVQEAREAKPAEYKDVHVPPQNYWDLIKVSEAIKAYGKKRGKVIAPMVSAYSVSAGGLLFDNFIVGFTAPLEKEADLNLDGVISQEETYIAWAKGPAKWDSPRMRALFETYKTLMPEFAEGILAMNRDEATNRFVQQDAAMIMTGSWDVGSLLRASQGHFTLKTMRYPTPAAGEKVLVNGKQIDFGDSPEGAGGTPYVVGRKNSANSTGGAGYGIYKFTDAEHYAVALDFLHFLSSQKENEAFNKTSEWAPSVAGAASPDLGKPFLPNPEGYMARLQWDFNGELQGQFKSAVEDYLMDRVDYAGFVKKYDAAINNVGNGAEPAWSRLYLNDQMSVRDDEKSMAAHLTAALMASAAGDKGAGAAGAAKEGDKGDKDAEAAREETRKYNGILLQQVRKNDGEEHALRYRQLTGKMLEAK